MKTILENAILDSWKVGDNNSTHDKQNWRPRSLKFAEKGVDGQKFDPLLKKTDFDKFIFDTLHHFNAINVKLFGCFIKNIPER